MLADTAARREAFIVSRDFKHIGENATQGLVPGGASVNNSGRIAEASCDSLKYLRLLSSVDEPPSDADEFAAATVE